jgi:TolB protein
MMTKVKNLLLFGFALSLVLVACKTSPNAPGPPETSKSVELSPLDSPLATASPERERLDVLGDNSGRLVFHSDRSGALEVYLMNFPSGEIQRLTNFGAFEPSWDANCESLVFASGRIDPNSFELYVMNLQSMDQEILFSNQPADDWAPAWSPQEDVIAFQTNEGGRINVCLSEANGTRLGCLPGSATYAVPSWSPDGERLLVVSDRDGPYNIYSIDRQDFEDVEQITDNSYEDMHPHYSPSGEFIAFSSKRDDRQYDLYLINADGSDERRLTSSAGSELTPRWVDEEHLLFAFEEDGNWDIYVINPDGTGRTSIIASDALDKWPNWCSD